MTSFDSLESEAAWQITLNGFHEGEFGTTETTGGWNALVSVDAACLGNIGAPNDLPNRFHAAHGDATLDVWIRQSTDGQVSTVTANDDRYGTPRALFSVADDADVDDINPDRDWAWIDD